MMMLSVVSQLILLYCRGFPNSSQHMLNCPVYISAAIPNKPFGFGFG